MNAADVEALARRVDSARDYAELFRIVKLVVERALRRSRAGLMLGLASLGVSPGAFLGGYFVLGSNAIVLNRSVLDHIRVRDPASLNAYAFHVLLHEYLHTIGYLGEDEVRPLAYALSRDAIGEAHPSTRIAAAMAGMGVDGETPEFLKRLVFPEFGWRPESPGPIEIVKGFDPDATPYIG